jgi:hypothetical protein
MQEKVLGVRDLPPSGLFQVPSFGGRILTIHAKKDANYGVRLLFRFGCLIYNTHS